MSNEDLFPILRYFKYDHLPKHAQERAKPFCDLAYTVIELPPGLRKLLEAKDCAVRAGL